MKMNSTDRAFAIQVPVTVSPAEGHLVTPSGLKRFQQEGFSWEMRTQTSHMEKSPKGA